MPTSQTMPKETMHAPDRPTFTRAKAADVAAQLAALDPNEEIEFTYRRARTRDEVLRDLRSGARKMSEEAKARGLTMEKFCEIMEMNDDTRRNLFGE